MNPAPAASPSAPLARPISRPASSALARPAAAVVIGSLLVAVCAHLAVPLWFTPVPVTLQTFAVLLLGLVLSPGLAASALVLYLLEGMAGLPVLSPIGPAGFLHILGPTGGYLLSYPAAAALTGWLRRRIGKGGFTTSALAAAAGSVVILLAGAAWFAILTHCSAGAVFTLTIAPFLPGDILKVAAAAGAAAGLRRFRRS
jgi:biotin transport system substrate-specific component